MWLKAAETRGEVVLGQLEGTWSVEGRKDVGLQLNKDDLGSWRWWFERKRQQHVVTCGNATRVNNAQTTRNYLLTTE